MAGFHHRAPGIAGFGLLDKDVYVELIGEFVHLHPKTIALLFRLKDAGRVILVSDSVRDTDISGKTLPMEKGRLSGGAMTLAEMARRLMEAGFDEERITRAVTTNPRDYLEG